MRAASAALQFEHLKLAVIASIRQEDLVDLLTRAMAESQKVINARPVQVLPAPKADAGSPTDEVPDHSAPFPHNSKHRFSRL
jgi:hypothetical protein